MKKFIIILTSLFISFSVLANNINNDYLVLGCKLKNGKSVAIFYNGITPAYFYGKDLGKPEMIIPKNFNSVSSQVHYGKPTSLNSQMAYYRFTNGNINYVVFTEQGAMTDEDTNAVGVFKNGKLISKNNCVGEFETRINDIFTVVGDNVAIDSDEEASNWIVN